jgi:hypothetical protein
MTFNQIESVSNSQFGIKIDDSGVNPSSTALRFTNCWFVDNGTTAAHYQVYIGGAYSVAFENNVVDRGAASLAKGVHIWGTAQSGTSLVISGNECEYAGFEIGGVDATANHGGISIFGNYFSKNPGQAAAIVINRADQMVSYSNDFTGLTAGVYAYSFAATSNATIGPDYCIINYYTGSPTLSIIHGNTTASASYYLTTTATISISGGLTSNGVFGYKGTSGNIRTIDGGSLVVAAGGTTPHTINVYNDNQIAYAEILIVGGFGATANARAQTSIVKKIGVIFGINSNTAYDATATELLSSGDALNAALTLSSVAATGSDGTMTFTYRNTDGASEFTGVMTYTFMLRDGTRTPSKS